MGKPNRSTQRQKQASVGRHGGNRAGGNATRRIGERRSTQSAGKDPTRSKGR